VLLKHPEIVHSDLFKNVPAWPEPEAAEPEVSGSNVHIRKWENVEPEFDPKHLDKPTSGSGFESGDFETEIRKKKLGKVELTIRAENEVYPKDAPYTQGSSALGLKFSTAHFACLTLLALLSRLLV
jgi:hypothetical protein